MSNAELKFQCFDSASSGEDFFEVSPFSYLGCTFGFLSLN